MVALTTDIRIIKALDAFNLDQIERAVLYQAIVTDDDSARANAWKRIRSCLTSENRRMDVAVLIHNSNLAPMRTPSGVQVLRTIEMESAVTVARKAKGEV